MAAGIGRGGRKTAGERGLAGGNDGEHLGEKVKAGQRRFRVLGLGLGLGFRV